MPREQITHNPIVESHTPPPVDGIPSATVTVEEQRRNVHVIWQAMDCALQPELTGPCDGFVRVGVDVTVAELREMLAEAEALADAAATEQAGIGELDREDYVYRVISDVIERPQVNHAIRTLRRARNAAFGADD